VLPVVLPVLLVVWQRARFPGSMRVDTIAAVSVSNDATEEYEVSMVVGFGVRYVDRDGSKTGWFYMLVRVRGTNAIAEKMAKICDSYLLDDFRPSK